MGALASLLSKLTAMRWREILRRRKRGSGSRQKAPARKRRALTPSERLDLSVILPRGIHPFPSRTRKLSPAGPMVLHAPSVWERRSLPALNKGQSERSDWPFPFGRGGQKLVRMFDEISLYLYPDHLCLAEPSDSYVWSLGRFQLSGKLVNKNCLPLESDSRRGVASRISNSAHFQWRCGVVTHWRCWLPRRKCCPVHRP